MVENIVYSFENISLYKQDLMEMESGMWINDACVHLAGRKIEFRSKTENGMKLVSFLPPATFQLMRNVAPDLAKEFTQNFKIMNAHFAFIPVTNAQGLGDTGSHWSLLVYDTIEKKFYHLDSLGNSNGRVAKYCVESLKFLYNLKDCQYTSPKVPQQNNCVDCGVFAIAFMENIAKEGNLDHLFDVSSASVAELRKEFASKFFC